LDNLPLQADNRFGEEFGESYCTKSITIMDYE